MALHKLGISASELIRTFDTWYDWYHDDGISGMDCLIWEIWSKVNAGLASLKSHETHAKEEKLDEEEIRNIVVEALKSIHSTRDCYTTPRGRAHTQNCLGKILWVKQVKLISF